MRILITTTHVPFVDGGAESHSRSLQKALVDKGHQVDIVRIPFKWYPPERIHEHVLSCRLLDLQEANGVPVDKVIGLKFPAYHVRHPNKSIWVIHQFRTAFEMWGSEHCDLSPHPQGRAIRDSIESIERTLLPEARSIFANSGTVADRLMDHCGISADPLYHPPAKAESFHCQSFGDYLYFPSRLNKWKRQDLALRALALTRNPVKIRFSGVPDNPQYLKELTALSQKLGLGKRASFLGHLSFEDMVAQYAGARGILFLPHQEDYGYITLEAMLSSKPVITCSDSGGPTEFIRHEKEGFLCEPTPEAIAEQMDKLWEDVDMARHYGENGRTRYAELNISWDSVIEALLA